MMSYGIMGMGTIAAPMIYNVDLLPVGSKDSYFPRSVSEDARALNYLGFLSDNDLNDLTPSMGSQSADMNNEAGAWDPLFRGGITRYQSARGLTVDSWVGPQTRGSLAKDVLLKNAQPGALPPPPPVNPAQPIPVTPGGVPAKPAAIPGVTPASTGGGGLTTGEMIGIGAGVLVLGALGYYALS